MTLAAAPATLVAFVAPQPAVYLPALVVAQLLVFASTGPINSAIVNVVAPTERARAVGLSILAIHLFGDVPSPPLVGAISDATSLQRAFLILPAAFAAGGAIWLYAAWKAEAGEGRSVDRPGPLALAVVEHALAHADRGRASPRPARRR